MREYFFFVAIIIFFLFSELNAETTFHKEGVISWKNQVDNSWRKQSYNISRSVQRSAQSEHQSGLVYLNELRGGAGLVPYEPNIPLNNATQNHTDYLILHNLFTHQEDKETYPEGFTGSHSWDRGVAAGYNWSLGKPYSEIISAGNSDINDSIDSHFSAIYHRLGFLSLRNVDIGIGISKDSSYRFGSAYGFNMANEGNTTEAYQQNPKYVLWPYNNYDRVQSTFSNYEDPKPMPECARGGVTANPISIEFNPKKNNHISMQSFKLYALDGSEINNTKILTKENDPAGKLNENQFVLFAMNSLDINKGYKADFSYMESEVNKTVSWYFKTRSYPYCGYMVTKGAQYDVVAGKSYLLHIKPDNCNTAIKGYRYSGASVTVEQLEYDLIKVTPNSTTIGDITYFDFYNGMTFSLRVAENDCAKSFDDTSSLTKIANIHNDLNEASGMINIDGRLFLHNDSGHLPYLYEIDSTSGMILRTVVISGAENIDWEDAASDDTHVYIADIGNSRGARKDLKIYKILKTDLLTSETVSAEIINISYADQTIFTYDDFTTPYDAEAIVAFEGKLYIFTKNWDDYTTNVYAVPTTPGTYALNAMVKKQFDVMVTGADYDAATDSIVLVGYSNPYKTDKKLKSMIIMLSDFKDNDFFSGRIVTSEVKKEAGASQVESIVFYNDNELYIACEGMESDFVEYPATLFKTQIVPVFRTSDCGKTCNSSLSQKKAGIPALLFLLISN